MKTPYQQDPVHYHVKGSEPNHPHHKDEETGWYHWDETWGERNGPYESREKAEEELHKYIEYLSRAKP